MKPKLLTTIIIIVIAAAITILLIAFFPIASGNDSIDINLHDTYFVVAHVHAASYYLMFFLILVFSARCVASRFRRRVENCLLLLLLFITETMCVKAVRFFTQLDASIAGWTVYPPLSALPKVAPHHDNMLVLFFSALQIIFTILLVIVAIITGKNWRKAAYETAS